MLAMGKCQKWTTFSPFLNNFSEDLLLTGQTKNGILEVNSKKNELDFFQEEVYSMKHYFLWFFQEQITADA